MENSIKEGVLQGELMAMQIVLNVLIATHPSREQVNELIEKQRLLGESFFLGSTRPDQALDAFCLTLDFLLGKDIPPPEDGGAGRKPPLRLV